jgi:hypothetical protein
MIHHLMLPTVKPVLRQKREADKAVDKLQRPFGLAYT